MIWSPESRLADITAALESYAVQVKKDGLVYQQGPLYWCERIEVNMKECPFFPVVDRKIELSLIRWASPEFNRGHRWPFFVDEPLELCFTLGDQWWSYKFTPGKTYEERHIDFGERPETAPLPPDGVSPNKKE